MLSYLGFRLRVSLDVGSADLLYDELSTWQVDSFNCCNISYFTRIYPNLP